MRVGIVGTGAIAHKHARAYHEIGYQVVACTNHTRERGEQFAREFAAEFVPSYEELCRDRRIDFVDICTFPGFRLPVLEACAENKKHVQVEKPIATDLRTAAQMIALTEQAGIQFGVVSQHRFDDSSLFLHSAIRDGRLGKILQADAYVKWFRSPEYYARSAKGSWSAEGGGALINQAIHQLDLLLWLIGPIAEVFSYWQLGALHKIESEDIVNALLKYRNGATGVLQASTAFWPGYSERIEIHGAKGTAIVAGDQLITWDVANDSGEPAPLSRGAASGASDPMAISLQSFVRQFVDFGQAIQSGRPPLCSGHDGYRALQAVTAIYDSCRRAHKVSVSSLGESIGGELG